MEDLFSKAWGLMVTAFAALLSFFMYKQREASNRMYKAEDAISDHKCDIGIIKTKLVNVDDKLEDIVVAQARILKILNSRQRKAQ